MSTTLLLVEDEEGLVDYLRTELQFEDYTVYVANDGKTALSTFENLRGQLDVILLDWMLPKLDGLEVLRRIRKTSDMPVVMMTARDYVGDKVAGLDTGADDYITKPFEIEELLARLRVILRHKKTETRPSQESSYQIDDLILNTKLRQVTRNNQIIQLTQREYELLLTLIQHSGETMSRDDLLNTVWGIDFEGQPNVVDVYIRYLRNKIDRDFGAKLIHTVRGVGYVLSANYQS
ncbi:response regulator transcription factor [Secundilactobacillus similis]|uniref:Response regulator n=1 Tax=Secundilactobacillus similis DSM 23365 = JCM 2765 TaxID=1423804 RepID=A0A0R2EPT1_9LACO|nr:response regulator transcription factor [Secundilactobacillus similis]KRN18232.1 response regulator [Secundilactobacillus similis DSM 23365 = JCM 2765]